MLEIEALQNSSNKLNEERIFDLKQRIEDLMMERDTLNAHSKQQKKELSSLRYVQHNQHKCSRPAQSNLNQSLYVR